MFRSFIKTARSLVEESFLMLTDELIVEIRCSKFSVANAIVSFAIPVSHFAKLKFRREESISYFLFLFTLSKLQKTPSSTNAPAALTQ